MVAYSPDDSLGSGVRIHDPTHSLGSGVGASDSLGSGVRTHDPTLGLGSGVSASDSLGSGIVTHDPTLSLGSGVGASDRLGSGVVTHDPTLSFGSGVGASDSLRSGVVTHDPILSLGSGVGASDSLGSGVGTHDPTNSLGSGVGASDSLGSGAVTHDPTLSLGSGVGASDSPGSGVVTHDPTHSLGSGVGASDSLWSGVVTHDPSDSLESGVETRGPARPGKRLYRRNTVFDVQPEALQDRVPMGPGATRVGLEAKSGTTWKVRMLSVRRPDNAGETTSLVATENQEPRLDTDRVAPNANGADRGRPSRSGVQGQEGTASDDTDDSERNTQELRYYSDDGAESDLSGPEGNGRSRADAASRGQSRHLVPEVGLFQRLEQVPSPNRPLSIMSLDGLEAYTHRTPGLSGPYDGGGVVLRPDLVLGRWTTDLYRSSSTSRDLGLGR